MSLEREMKLVKAAVSEAAEAIMRIAEHGFEADYKADNSPLTAADLEADRILKETLTKNFSDYGWLSEETRDHPSRLECRRVWIVDPIDGTREFTMQIPEYAISVALAERGEPILGVICNPSTGELFEAVRGGGTKLNSQPVSSNHPLGDRPVVEASRSDIEKGRFAAFESLMEIRPCGSIAYKLARLAAGKADSVFSLTPKNEWDIAAGVILVAEAGGKVAGTSGEAFVF
ncbi:unnamed protein product, partial [marine sediment metagenome]